MSNLILRQKISPAGLPFNLVLTQKPDPVVTESFVGDIYWRFDDEPDAEPKYLGSAVAGSTFRTTALDVAKGRAIRLFLVSRSEDARFSVDALREAVQTVVEINTETATPEIGQLTAASNTQVTLGVYGFTQAAKYRKVQVANNNTFSSGLVESILQSADYAGSVFPADLLITKPPSSGTETKYMRVAHSSNGTDYSPWSNTLTVTFADSGGSGGSGGGWDGTCFDASTLIMTPTVSKRIAEIRPGDTVLAFDTRGNLHHAKVTASRSHIADQAIRFKGDLLDLCVTGEHLILDSDNRFKRARDFVAGDTLWRVTPDGIWKRVLIESVEITGSPLAVYSIEVEPLHTHFANGIAVHNAKQVDL